MSIHINSLRAFMQGSDELFGKRHRQIIGIFRRSPGPRTDREIMIALGFSDPNSCRPRITELVETGVLVEYGETECPITKKTVRLVTLAKQQAAQSEFNLGQVITPAVIQTLKDRKPE